MFDRLVLGGEQVVQLLDAVRDPRDLVESVVGTERARVLGPLKRVDGEKVRLEDLKIAVTYWGGGKGRWKPRPYVSEEAPAPEYADLWGNSTGDLYINEETYFSNVPEAVWTYQLGGYPVLKKWLGYRQLDRRGGRPISDYERRAFRQIVQRIAALLALSPLLDELYQEAAASSFTAEELSISR